MSTLSTRLDRLENAAPPSRPWKWLKQEIWPDGPVPTDAELDAERARLSAEGYEMRVWVLDFTRPYEPNE